VPTNQRAFGCKRKIVVFQKGGKVSFRHMVTVSSRENRRKIISIGRRSLSAPLTELGRKYIERDTTLSKSAITAGGKSRLPLKTKKKQRGHTDLKRVVGKSHLVGGRKEPILTEKTT